MEVFGKNIDRNKGISQKLEIVSEFLDELTLSPYYQKAPPIINRPEFQATAQQFYGQHIRFYWH